MGNKSAEGEALDDPSRGGADAQEWGILEHPSHEMRTPLGAILGFAQLMESAQPALAASQRRNLDFIIQAGFAGGHDARVPILDRGAGANARSAGPDSRCDRRIYRSRSTGRRAPRTRPMITPTASRGKRNED